MSKLRDAIQSGQLEFGTMRNGSRSLWADEKAFQTHVLLSLKANIDNSIKLLKKAAKSGGRLSDAETESLYQTLDFIEYLSEADGDESKTRVSKS